MKDSFSNRNTVLRYIATKLDLSHSYYPQDIETRTKIVCLTNKILLKNKNLRYFQDLFLDWSIHHFLPATCAILEIGTTYSPHTYQFVSEKRHQPTVEEIGNVTKGYIDVLREMEKLFLQNTEFLAGDEITIADISAACEIMFARVFNIDFTPYPHVCYSFHKYICQFLYLLCKL